MSFKEFIYPTKKKVIVSVVFLLLLEILFFWMSLPSYDLTYYDWLDFSFFIFFSLITLLPTVFLVYLETCIIFSLFQKNAGIIAILSLVLISIMEIFIIIYSANNQWILRNFGALCKACVGCLCSVSYILGFRLALYLLIPITIFVYFIVSLSSFFLKKD